MKKILFVFMVALLALGINEANAQIRVGGGLVYNTEAEQLGLNVRGAFGVTEKIDVVAKINWLFPEKESGITVSWTGINGDVHYNFLDRDASFTPYALAGVDVSVIRVKFNSNSNSESYFGVNVGAGFEYSITESLNLFVEGKYLQIFEDGVDGTIVFSAGVVLPL